MFARRPTTSVSSLPTHSSPMSIVGAPYPSSDETVMPARLGSVPQGASPAGFVLWIRLSIGLSGSSHWEFCSYPLNTKGVPTNPDRIRSNMYITAGA